MSVPCPPWKLNGSALVFLEPHFRVLALVRYDSSPVGPYHELALGAWKRNGPSVLDMPVDSQDTLIAGRALWGFPKTLASLDWQQQNEHVVFSFHQGKNKQTWRARGLGPTFSLKLRFSSTQKLDGQAVRVPIRLKAHARFALGGKRLGLWLKSFEMEVLPPKPK